MKHVALEELVPDFELPATGDRRVRFSDLRGRNVVLYFYPKDDTPGCTQEGKDFRERYGDFQRLESVVFGVSRDSLDSHERFRAKMGFPFDLMSDTDEVACTLFDVIRMKNLYGKQVRGIERSTFLVDREGRLRREWRKVKVPGHVAEVLAALEEL